MRMSALCLATCLLVAACGGGASDTIVVFAPASTTNVVNELAGGFGGASVKTSFGASSDLARQIKDGAPAHVFISASGTWVDYLNDAGALDGESVVFARNVLVCVAPADSVLEAGDAATLLGKLSGTDRIAIADEGVPAGDYARQSMAATGDLVRMRPWLVGQKDVRAVVRAVEMGECAGGFVYATDAKVANVKVLFTFAPGTHKPIEYYAAVVKGGGARAREFIQYIVSEPARAGLRDAGFILP